MNRDLVSKILSGRRWPTVKQLDTLVRVLADRAVHGPSADEESQRFLTLWTAAEEPFSEPGTEGRSTDPMNRAFEAASAMGEVTPIVELVANRPPEYVLKVVSELKARRWANFAVGLLEGLADRLDPGRLPALTALIPSNQVPSDRRTVLNRFAQVRSIAEVCHLATLFSRAGSVSEAAILIDVVRKERPIRHTCELFVGLHRNGHDWEAGSNWNSLEVWPASPVIIVEMVREFWALGHPECVPLLVTRYGKGHSGAHRWELYEVLGQAGMPDVRRDLVASLIEFVPVREVAEFVASAESAGKRDVAVKVIKGVMCSRSDPEVSYFIQALPPGLEESARK